MDTIVNVCRRARGPRGDAGRAYEITIFRIRDYRLIRVELGEDFPEKLPAGRLGAGQQAEPLRSRRFFWKKASLRENRSAGRSQRHQENPAAELVADLEALLDERDDNYCRVAKELEKSCDWREILPLPVFDGYLEREWAQRLLGYAIYSDFVVLGTAPYLTEIICGLAPRMRSLQWILPDPFQAGMLEDFAEDFYQEYGLAIDMRFPDAAESYGRIRLEGKGIREPVSILDFTRGGGIPELAPEAGGIWLDMAASEEKERRIEARKWRVFYFSLKKQWEQPQKWS